MIAEDQIDLVGELIKEWRKIEDFRKQCLVDLVSICRSMKELNSRLTEEQMEVLVENEWKRGEVVKEINNGVCSLIRAINALSRNKTFDQVIP